MYLNSISHQTCSISVWKRRSVAGHLSPDHRLCSMMFVTTELDTLSSKGHSREGVRGTCAPAKPTYYGTAANATSLFAQLASTHITLADITTIQVSFKASVLYIGQSIFQQM